MPVIIYSLVIMMLNKAYRGIAEYLTGPQAPPSLLSPSVRPTHVTAPPLRKYAPTAGDVDTNA